MDEIIGVIVSVFVSALFLAFIIFMVIMVFAEGYQMLLGIAIPIGVGVWGVNWYRK